MHRHPNEERLALLYERFGAGDFAGVLEMCADEITFRVPAGAPFSGVHGKADFQEWIGEVWSISGGTFREVPHRIIANDHHGVVLLDHYLTRDGREIHYRVCHLWQIQDGRFTRWEEWAGDEQAFAAAWS